MNREWVAAFPDPASRPARHIFMHDALAGDMQVQCDVFAVASRDWPGGGGRGVRDG